MLGQSDNGPMSWVVGRDQDAAVGSRVRRRARKQDDVGDDRVTGPAPDSRAGVPQHRQGPREGRVGGPAGIRTGIGWPSRGGRCHWSGPAGGPRQLGGFLLLRGRRHRSAQRNQQARHVRSVAYKERQPDREEDEPNAHHDRRAGSPFLAIVLALDPQLGRSAWVSRRLLLVAGNGKSVGRLRIGRLLRDCTDRAEQAVGRERLRDQRLARPEQAQFHQLLGQRG